MVRNRSYMGRQDQSSREQPEPLGQYVVPAEPNVAGFGTAHLSFASRSLRHAGPLDRFVFNLLVLTQRRWSSGRGPMALPKHWPGVRDAPEAPGRFC